MEKREITYKNISNIYTINEYGEIYSKYYKKILKPKKDKDGYLTISLVSNDGKRLSYRIATLVAHTFIGECPNNIKDPTVNHKDENKLNNHYSNLEWMERVENSKVRTYKPKGGLNNSAVLLENDVKKICELLISTNFTYLEISQLFNIDKSTVSNIKNGKTWAYITEQFPLLSECRTKIRNKTNGRMETINPLLIGSTGKN